MSKALINGMRGTVGCERLVWGNAVGIWVVAGLLFAGWTGSATAQPRIELPGTSIERRLPREEILIETVRIEGIAQVWVLRKICLEGQAYWIGFSETSPTGISVSFKDGKPEQCSVRAR